MSKFSDYLEGKIIETTLRGAAMPAPSNIYIALFTSDPSDANTTANEVQLETFDPHLRIMFADFFHLVIEWIIA